jgi:large subunit ribosomal protein L17
MKHAIKGRKLNRNTAHRKALMRNLSIALLEKEIIKTTLPKAKELRPFVEKLITIAKKNSIENRRLLTSILGNEKIVDRMYKEIAPRINDRKGGYTRILKFGYRVGDKAPMAVIELVDRVLKEEVSEESEKQINQD